MSKKISKNVVECELCHEEYEPVFDYAKHFNQGIDCSSFVTDEGVYGCYGSKEIDLQYWVWTNGMPKRLEEIFNGIENVVCDNCVRDMKKNNEIKFDKNRAVW